MILLHILDVVTKVIEPTPAPSTIVYIVGSALGGGAISGVVAWLRFGKLGRAEKEEMITKAAAQAVIALQASLTRLEIELKDAEKQRDKLERDLKAALIERVRLEEKLRALTLRIADLEDRIAQYNKIGINHENKI